MSVAELPGTSISLQAGESLVAMLVAADRKHLQYAKDKRNETMRNGELMGGGSGGVVAQVLRWWGWLHVMPAHLRSMCGKQ